MHKQYINFSENTHTFNFNEIINSLLISKTKFENCAKINSNSPFLEIRKRELLIKRSQNIYFKFIDLFIIKTKN